MAAAKPTFRTIDGVSVRFVESDRRDTDVPHSGLRVVDSGHFIWEDAADEYAALVNAWWTEGFKTYMETPTAIAASS